MQKKGHLLIASTIKPLFPKYHFWLSLGSIFPDILVHTYLRGHTFAAAADITFARIERLRTHGRLNRRSLFMLGYILHYVEDFFTFPHNPTFYGSLLDHPRYEIRQYSFLKETAPALGSGEKPLCLTGQLLELHDAYLAETPGLITDRKYIFEAAECVARYFSTELSANEASARLAPNPLISAFFALMNY